MSDEKKELQIIIKEMIILFEGSGLNSWVETYSNMLQVLEDDVDYVKYQLAISFGGMGAINDLVLYRKGVLLITENNQLDELRQKLYILVTRR